MAAVVAAAVGVGLQNLTGWLGNKGGFDARKAASSAIIAVIIGIPVIVAGFTAAFSEVETIPEQAQLVLFVIQIGAVAGFGALAKGGAKAAAKTNTTG